MAFWDDLNFNPFESTDDDNDFFSGFWTDRSEDAYKDFFSDGGWKDWKNWVNPGGVVANPAQQIADPGNFFTSEEHENWLNGEGVSDRTKMSAVVAGAAYGGGAAINSFSGSGSSLSAADSGNLLAREGIGSAGTTGGGGWNGTSTLAGNSGSSTAAGSDWADNLSQMSDSTGGGDEEEKQQGPQAPSLLGLSRVPTRKIKPRGVASPPRRMTLSQYNSPVRRGGMDDFK